MNSLLQDIHYALRQLHRKPGFTIIAVLTLALGLGANTAVFSMVNALLWHPYNFPELDRIVLVWQEQGSEANADARYMAPGDASDVASSANLFDSLATYQCQMFSTESGSEVLPVRGCAVSANFFDLLGVAPLTGRSFARSEQQPGLDAVTVVSHAYWQRQLGGDPGAIGKSVRLNGRKFTVIGIMPVNFSFPVVMQLWIPLALTPDQQADRSQLSVQAIARLKPREDVTRARAALAGFSEQLANEYPKTNGGRKTTLLPLRQELYQYTLPLFSLLQAAAGFVLLLTCANLANLFLARMIGRQKEIAVRAALGAARQQLAQLFLSETIFFSLLAAALTIGVSLLTVRLLRTGISPDWTKWVPGWSGIQVDRTVFAFTILVAFAIGAFFGLMTFAQARRRDLHSALKEGSPGSTASRARLRSGLVVAQLVFALVLLVCAGLMIQGFTRMAKVYADFRPANVIEFEPVLPASSYVDKTKISNLYEQLLRNSVELPGVTSAALISNPPASNVDNSSTTFAIEGRPAPRPGEAPSAGFQVASPDFFRALLIPVISGRAFSENDNATGEAVAIVNRGMATAFWPHAEALGQHVRLTDPNTASPWLTVVGVVEDVRQNWWNSPSQPTIYRPLLQAPDQGMTLVLRTNADPTGYVSPIRAILRQLDSSIALAEVRTLDNEVRDSVGIIRIMGVLMIVFGAIALALSAVGVYGVLSESVAQRTREIGIRMALGASESTVRALVLRHALKLTAVGLALAIPLAFAINRAMAALIFGVVSVDLRVIAAFSVVLVLVALAACYIPARRAAKVDPMVALRYE